MRVAVTRIISDLHYGDRASRVRRLEQLQPLLEEVDHLVLNGDTLDTRPSARPDRARAWREEAREFFRRHVPRTTWLTGNHDADLSEEHQLDLAQGEVFVFHGDIVFDAIVPWSRDAPVVRARLAEALAGLGPGAGDTLAGRTAAFRQVALTLPQRHQAGQRGLRPLLRYLADTVWPPHRAAAVLRAWASMPGRCVQLARRHRPGARFVVAGHTHYPGVWQPRGGPVVINTGSFTLPVGAYAVDLADGAVRVRPVRHRGTLFHAGPARAEFALAAARPMGEA